MLFHLPFSKKYDSPAEGVDANSNRWMIFNIHPGLLHGAGPVNVIKNKNTILVRRFKAL